MSAHLKKTPLTSFFSESLVAFIIIQVSLQIILRAYDDNNVYLTERMLFSLFYIMQIRDLHFENEPFKQTFLRFVAYCGLKLFLAQVAILMFFWFLRYEHKGIIQLSFNFNIQWFFLVWTMFTTVRFARLKLIQFLLSKKQRGRKTAIIGLTDSGLRIANSIKKSFAPSEICFYDSKDKYRNFGYLLKADYAGDLKQLLIDIKNEKIVEIYIAFPLTERDKINAVLGKLSDELIKIFVVPDLYNYKLALSQIHNVNGLPTFSVFGTSLRGWNVLVKRIEDILLSFFIILLISPVLLVIATIIKFTSKGPVLFKQDRYGLDAKSIKVWKFRSMSVMENAAEVTQATKNDPRVTPFGGFLRRTSLDELPQFFNVLMGDMSVVGPRPHAMTHNDQYRVLVDDYITRLKIKPGITGLAQIKGWRGETDSLYKMKKRVHYDLKYIQTWSLSLDLKIVVATVFKGFVSDSAY